MLSSDFKSKKAAIVALGMMLLPALAAANTYMGSAVCSGCHGALPLDNPQIHNRWKETNHAKIYDTNIAPVDFISDWTDGKVVTLNRTTTVTVQVTLHTTPDYGVTIGGTRHKVIRVHGAVANPEDVDPDAARATKPGHTAYIGKQRYHVKIGNSDYILPIQWNPVKDLDGKNNGWSGYNVQNWFDAAGNPITPAKDKSEARDCAGCHQTGVVPTHDGTDWRITRIEENIGCESCHGQGGDHVAQGGAGPIVNPSKLTAQQSNDVCGSCHSRGESVGTLGGMKLSYPYNGTRTFQPGDNLADFYVRTTKPADYWGNGVSKSHHQQSHDFLLSDHSSMGVRCTACHDTHGTTNEHQLKTTARNNQLCQSCHSAQFPDANAVASHSRHPAGVAGVPRCVDCHMPAVQKSSVNYDIHSHAFKTLTAQDTLTFKMPSSCAIDCHRSAPQGPRTITDTNVGAWDEASDVTIAKWLVKQWQAAVRAVWNMYR